MNELLVLAMITLGVAVLGVLAVRYGYDSRTGLRSNEEEMASMGMSWNELAYQQQLAEEMRAARQRLVGVAPRPRRQTSTGYLRPAGLAG